MKSANIIIPAIISPLSKIIFSEKRGKSSRKKNLDYLGKYFCQGFFQDNVSPPPPPPPPPFRGI